VFGSDGHQWTGTPVELAELADLEAFLGARLPPEISAFYTLVGHGVGPNYGLWPPQRIRAAVALDREDFADEGLPLLDIGGPFPITARDLAAQMPPIRPNPLPGSVRFCERGCGYYSALALTGELAGTVWDVEGSDWSPGAEWWPARVPRQHELPSGPVHFFDWYEDWLTDSEQRLGLT
jgi:hypothetical protein